MLIGYARVSTTGQNLESQIEHLQAVGCDKIYQEKLTGFDRRRPQLEKMLASLQSGDTLVVTSLDRLARSTHDLFVITQKTEASEASFRSLREPWADTTSSRWHRRCTPAGAFGGAARQWRTGHHVALPHPPDSGRGLRLMWPFRKSAETRSSSGGFTMPRPADIIRHLPGRTPIMGADAAWEVAMISRIWDEDATIVVAKRCSWRSRSASGGWAIRPAQGWHSRTPGRQHVQSTAIRSRSAWGITRQAVPQLTDAEFRGDAT